MGNDDLTCESDEALVSSVKKVREGFEEFEQLKHLQLEFMEGHDMLSDKVFLTTYADGTRVITNYGDVAFEYKGISVAPLAYKMVKVQR